jgi:hypothetical protein
VIMAIRPTALVPLLQVFDMLEAIRFYRDVLGYSVVSSSDEIEAAEGRYFHWAPSGARCMSLARGTDP